MLDNIEVLTGAAAVAEGEQTGNEGGFRAPARGPQFAKRLIEAADIWGEALHAGGLAGFKARARLVEALATPDFPYLLGGVIDRELLREYNQAPSVWSKFAMRTTLRDFREKNLIDLLGGRGILDPVKPGEEYKARAATESKYAISVGKRGARFALTWEMLVNDDLDAFRTLPGRLSDASHVTEDYLATSQLVTSTGANTAFFKAANGNAPTALALTTDNLAAAITAVQNRKDSDGNPIDLSAGVVLLVPPSLEMTAMQIVNAVEIRVTDGSNQLVTANYLKSKVTIVVDPWLTVIATDGKAATRWFLLPQPTAPRPAIAVGFLRGHEVPDLRVKSDAGMRVGGGVIDPTEGSFDFDDLQYRVRHVIGAATVDPKVTYCSDGS
ncbi:Mu-like prophage major head subunit gpT family protein [Actinotalea sp. M2MS4P-6]|uniref:Mu-like prophage major head subunit gpT family protein n=1 Tax=Actinotalea sp. M2MS4P-6 TaxID=2983762 RepID=UPI0021E4CBFB|nr:Mu-like prophage major head subunit gpT family protein [Actinotalea sp. M2MS4P-6]MCV2395928.1 Mu-like prophage major head subunit gpT family protein [Actinotalea sp. M2MS4P-6]